MRGTEPALNKCQKCGDQLLSIPGRNHVDSRRIICPVCVTNNYEDLLAREGMLAGTLPPSMGTVILSREEIERCSE